MFEDPQNCCTKSAKRVFQQNRSIADVHVGSPTAARTKAPDWVSRNWCLDAACQIKSELLQILRHARRADLIGLRAGMLHRHGPAPDFRAEKLAELARAGEARRHAGLLECGDQLAAGGDP